MNRIELLPIWTLSDGIPSVYDTTSGTYQEMVAKVYGAMRNLQLDYNSFANEINDAITKYINVDQQTFKDEITKIVHNYIVMIDTAIDHQDRVINENITYIKHNLATEVTSVISEMKDSGELDIIIGDAIGGLGERIEALENRQIPSNVSELNNDLQYATQDYVDNEIATFDFIKVVDTLPEQGLENRIYFVPKADSQTKDLFDEYAWINNKWEWITTKQLDVDLTPYYKKTEVYNKSEIDTEINEINSALSGINSTLSTIVESGNSGNKYWLKYDNGIMIQWGYISWSWYEFIESGNLYRSNLVSLTLPQAFTQNTLQSGYCSLQSVAESNGLYWNQSAYFKDTSTIEGYFMKTTSGNSDIYARYFAIGKWK